ncbi:MAG: DUF2784 domain-containing protein [Gammaproteobacteria bacterium]
MIYMLLADLVLILHAAFVLFVVLGGLPVLRWHWWKWLHLPALAWGAWIELSGGVCPLTPIEAHLRRLAHQEGTSGVVEPYLLPLLYPVGLTREDQWWLAVLLLGFNALVYSIAWGIGRRRR